MRRCWLAIREDLRYRFDQFKRGFERIGFEVHSGITHDPHPTDVLCIWNRYSPFHQIAKDFERAGAQVLVAENGYLGKSWRGGEWFALARNYHNGAGTWTDRGPERWDSWRVELAPLRSHRSGPVLLLAQRGIGSPGVAMPHDWAEATLARLRREGHLASLRPHPGKAKDRGGPDYDDGLGAALASAGAALTWGSGAGLKAMIAGVPTYTTFPRWIGRPAAAPLDDLLCGRPYEDRRLETFQRLAWAMWELNEISSGEALCHLLS